MELPRGGATLSLKHQESRRDLIETMDQNLDKCQFVEMQEIVSSAGNWDWVLFNPQNKASEVNK